MLISFLFLHENKCCGYSLEAPRQGASNEYTQHRFLSRNKKNIMWIPPLICSYGTSMIKEYTCDSIIIWSVGLILDRRRICNISEMIVWHFKIVCGSFWNSQLRHYNCNDLQSPNRHSRNQHPMAFQVPYARTDIYKYSFLPDTIRDWNALPASIISSAENSEDPVARLTSLVRSRD